MFPFPIIEKLSLVAPLGLCFHDAATGERVTDGLSVSVYPAAQKIRKKRIEAVPNRSGVYVLHRAEGLEEFSRGAGEAKFYRAAEEEFSKKEKDKKSFIAEVFDYRNRFQPFQITLQLPVKGIYRWENVPPGAPNGNHSSIPLYSAPSRSPSGGMAVIRAQLRENEEKAASYAVLEASFNGGLVARGIADGEGRIALMFPALSPQSSPLSDAPGATRVSLADQQWNLDLTIGYEPEVLPAAPFALTGKEEMVLPDLRLMLAQKNGKLWADAEKTENLTTVVLQTGRELILRSRAKTIPSPPPAEPDFSSYLFVSPA